MRNKNLAQQIYCYYIYLFYFDVIFYFLCFDVIWINSGKDNIKITSMKLKYKEQIMGSMVKTYEETIYLFLNSQNERMCFNHLQVSFPGCTSFISLLIS